MMILRFLLRNVIIQNLVFCNLLRLFYISCNLYFILNLKYFVKFTRNCKEILRHKNILYHVL